MNTQTSDKHKFLADSRMTFQEVYDFAFKGFISIMQNLANELGQERFLEILQRTTFEAILQGGPDPANNLQNNDLATLTAWAKDLNHFWKHVLTLDIIEDTDTAFEINVTECLWAKTFRENGGSDIGYATTCHPDYAICQAFNPKIKMVRTKTLMQRDDCCNHRWIWEE